MQATAAAEAHRAAALQLWAGDFAAALRTVIAADALTADFVSMAAAAGMSVQLLCSHAHAWQALCRQVAAACCSVCVCLSDCGAATSYIKTDAVASPDPRASSFSVASPGKEAWRAAVGAYAAQLESRGEPQLAALHLLSTGNVHSALGARPHERMAPMPYSFKALLVTLMAA